MYTLEYITEQSSATWLNTNANYILTINVHETLESMSYRDDFGPNLANSPLDEKGVAGHPKRTELYANLMIEILESKGNLRN